MTYEGPTDSCHEGQEQCTNAPGAGGGGTRRPFTAGNGARLGKTRRDLEDVGLREAGFDPVGDAGMLPDQRVGGHAQRLHLVRTRDLDVDDMGLALDPPAAVPVDPGLPDRRARPEAFGDEARDEVAAKLADEQAQPG